MEPFALTVMRFLSGFAMLQIIGISRPRSFERERISTRYIWAALFLGSYAFAQSFGYRFISAGAGVLVFFGVVVLTMGLYSVLLDKEKLTSRLVVSQIIGILGVFVITFGRLGSVSYTGVILMAVTGISWGLYSAYGRRFHSGFSYTYNTFLVFGIISLALIPLDHAFLNKSDWSNISFSAVGLALCMGTISTALSFVLWNRVVKKIGTVVGGLTQLIVPPLSVGMAAILLSEKISAPLIVGGALILGGICMSTSRSLQDWGRTPRSLGGWVRGGLWGSTWRKS
jgi:drug/metabolite transporter (DMT)-like permease